MKTTGYFPIEVPLDRSGLNFTAYRRSDGKKMGSFFQTTTSGPLAGIAQHVRNLYTTSFPLAPWTVSSSFSQSSYGGYRVREVGDPTPTPQPLVLQGKDIKVNNRELMKNAKRDNLIVVSDYERIRMLCTFRNGGRTIKGITTYNRVSIVLVCSVLGIPRITHPDIGLCYDVGGEYLISDTGNMFVTYEAQERDDDVTAYDDGFNVTALQDFINTPLGMFHENLESEVTSVVADANTSTLDLLTSLAEMPETVRSIYDGLKFMLRGLKDVKQRNLAFAHKSKRVRIEHERKVFRLEHETRLAYLAARNERTKRIIQAKKAQKLKQLENDVKRNLDDIVKEAASVWLNYRYNIEPTFMMIESAIDAYFEQDALFKRWSSRTIYQVSPPPITGFRLTGQFDLTQRIFIKRCFRKGLPFGQSLSANIFTTAWELIPLSFVLDWIINIGDFIATSASSTLSKVSIEGSTLSLKCDGQVNYTGANDTVVTCELLGYKRIKINPNDYCRLVISPDITGKRQIDAIALSWQIFVKRIWK